MLAPGIHLECVPTCSIAGPPEPSVRYRGATRPANRRIELVDSNATVSISVERIIAAMKTLRERNDHLKVACGRAVASAQSDAFIARVAAAASDVRTCARGSAPCGRAKRSQRRIEQAQASFEQALQVTPLGATNAAERAAALQGPGEIHVGEGRLDQAGDVLGKASRLGNAPPARRLEHIDEIRAARCTLRSAPGPSTRRQAVAARASRVRTSLIAGTPASHRWRRRAAGQRL